MSMTHPFDPECLYELTEDGTIRITKDGKTGLFTGEGIHIEGEIREADLSSAIGSLTYRTLILR